MEFPTLNDVCEMIVNFDRTTGKYPECIYLGVETMKEIYSDPSIKQLLIRDAVSRRDKLYSLPVYIVNTKHHMRCS